MRRRKLGGSAQINLRPCEINVLDTRGIKSCRPCNFQLLRHLIAKCVSSLRSLCFPSMETFPPFLLHFIFSTCILGALLLRLQSPALINFSQLLSRYCHLIFFCFFKSKVMPLKCSKISFQWLRMLITQRWKRWSLIEKLNSPIRNYLNSW